MCLVLTPAQIIPVLKEDIVRRAGTSFDQYPFGS